MHAKLKELRDKRENGDHGFTLIELLVVVVIIGILIAIAIPLYLHFENGAKNSSAESDVRNAVAVVNQCASDNGGSLPATQTGTAGADLSFTCSGTTETATVSTGNTVIYTLSGTDYTITGTNGTGPTYTYTSSTGKIEKSGTTSSSSAPA